MVIFAAAAASVALKARTPRPAPQFEPTREYYWKVGADSREFDSLQGAVRERIAVDPGQRVEVTQYEAKLGFSAKRLARSGLATAARLMASLVSPLAAVDNLEAYAKRKSERGELLRSGEIFIDKAPQNSQRQAVCYVETEGPCPSHRNGQPAFIAFI